MTFFLTMLALLTFLTVTLIIVCRIHFERIRSRSCYNIGLERNRGTKPSTKEKVIGFFHPHCSAGGGGERVLWKSIEALGQIHEAGFPLRVAIYTVDSPGESFEGDLLRHVKARFSISVSESLPITYVHLHEVASFLEPTSQRQSMIAQSAGTIKLAWAALQKFTPHIYIDTTGCAFTFLVAKVLAGCKVGAYVHYPTISTDMLSMVWERRPSYNHNSSIAQSNVGTYIKLIYYTLFAICYGLVGSLADLVMVNSTWTYNHIKYLWRLAPDIKVVFPPCDTASLEGLPLSPREPIVLSIGQFRPEKDHALQLRSFAKLLSLHPRLESDIGGKPRLLLLGSCRGEDDKDRVSELQMLATTLGISDNVEFVLNQPYPVLKEWFGRASVGVHTMWNEHFGIGIVEMMAAGLITIGHNSGGPKSDIIVPLDGECVGYLASTEEEYANAMFEALQGATKERNSKVRQKGRESAKRFSDQVFIDSFKSALMSSRIFT